MCLCAAACELVSGARMGTVRVIETHETAQSRMLANGTVIHLPLQHKYIKSSVLLLVHICPL